MAKLIHNQPHLIIPPISGCRFFAPQNMVNIMVKQTGATVGFYAVKNVGSTTSANQPIFVNLLNKAPLPPTIILPSAAFLRGFLSGKPALYHSGVLLFSLQCLACFHLALRLWFAVAPLESTGVIVSSTRSTGTRFLLYVKAVAVRMFGLLIPFPEHIAGKYPILHTGRNKFRHRIRVGHIQNGYNRT